MTRMLTATQTHLNSLQGMGHAFISPGIGLPACYGEVAAAQVEQRTGNVTFLLFVKGIKMELQLTDRGPCRPLWVCTVPNDYARLRTNNARTIHLNTNLVNIYYS